MKIVPERESVYEYFQYMGTRPCEPVAETAKCSLKPNKISNLFSASVKKFMEESKGDYVITNSTREHLEKSVKKMDRLVNYSIKEHPLFPCAVELTGRMYDLAFRQGPLSYDVVMEEVVRDTSSGIIEQLRGLPKKGDCLLADLPTLEYENPDLKEIPIWKVSGKVEIKERASYIGETKQRTFIIEPFGHLWQTKRVYGMQNKMLKLLGWSAYGMNPYEGGVDRLASKLNQYRRKWEFDGKSWDRILSIMKEVYDLRDSYGEESELRNWVRFWLINSVLQLPNGDVILKSWGNNSGSGNTTGDNIIAMTIFLHLVYLHLGLSADEIREKVFAAVFGDDVVGGDNTTFTDAEVENAFRTIFTTLGGIELDPFKISSNIEDLKFLGFSFAKCGDYYIPKYPLDRLAASVLGNLKTMDEVAELNKLTSLMLMSAGNGFVVFNFFRQAVLDVIYASDHPDIVKMRTMELSTVVPYYDLVISWYLGLEGCFHWNVEYDL